MPDEPAPTETADAPPTPSDEEIDPERLPGLKKAFQSERETRKALEAKVKELEPLAKAAQEREEADKSETTKLNEALAGERTARTKAEADLLRYTVGVAKGVPANLIGHITGATKEEVEQSADALLEALGEARPQIPGRPTERSTNGRMANGQPSKSTLDDEDPIALIRRGRGQEAPKR
jgi:hypothetical protein